MGAQIEKFPCKFAVKAKLSAGQSLHIIYKNSVSKVEHDFTRIKELLVLANKYQVHKTINQSYHKKYLAHHITGCPCQNLH